ncbi:hypothetical protein GT028_05445 [Streptomyces sp. SID2999]|nr:hypothetical protein [Streptomyces sp. SID2999]
MAPHPFDGDPPREEGRWGGTLRAAFPGAGVKETMDPHAQRQFVDIARHNQHRGRRCSVVFSRAVVRG